MLTFLNSVILFALGAITLPLLIHLFTRQKVKRVYFSTLEFLKEMRKQQIRRLKLRQLLLLILRMLILLLMVLAFARPTVRGNLSGGWEAQARTTAALIFDNTLSMSREEHGRYLLSEAKRRALEVINLLRPGDEVYLVLAHRPPKLLQESPFLNFEAVRKILDQSESTYWGTDLSGAIGLAQSRVAQSINVNKEIYVISDFQRSGFAKLAERPPISLRSQGIRLFAVPVGGEGTRNLALAGVEVVDKIIEQGKPVEIRALVKNTGSSPAKNALVELALEGKRVGQATVSLDPTGAEKVSFRVVPDKTGVLVGEVILEEDDLLYDNRRFFTLEVPEAIRVLLVGPKDEDTNFLRLALNPAPEVTPSHFQVQTLKPEKLNALAMNEAQVLVLSNVPKIESDQVRALKSFVENGGGLAVLLGTEVDLRNYNEGLVKALGLPLLGETYGLPGQGSPGPAAAFLTFGRIDFGHPLFKGVFEEEARHIDSPKFSVGIRAQASPTATPIIDYSNGMPFLIESKCGRGKVLVFTTALDENWSDFPFKAIFPPLVNRSVMYLAGRVRETAEEVLVGEEITAPVSGTALAGNLEMEKPDGNRIKVKPVVAEGVPKTGADVGSYAVRFNQTDMPGIYRLWSGGPQGEWAVNVDPQESELEPIDLDKLAEAYEGTFSVKGGEKIEEVVVRSRVGRELWKYCAAGALLLLLIEMVLFRERAGVVREQRAEA